MQTSPTMRWQRLAIPVLLLLLLLRLIAAWALPLTDKTEARYGEIARKMWETGDWVTLWHDYGVPFWAKPPLSTWLSAGSMDLLGATELAARLPSLLLAVATLLLACSLIRQRSGRDAALACALILGSGLLFLGTAGTVMTDSALLFCVTFSLVAVWRAVVLGSRAWGYLLFVGLGLGLLAKGPLAGVLVGLPVFFWVLLGNRWRALWQRLPWLTGIPLMLAIALPWYLLAEHRTPGFLNYFIVGEHLSRFLDAGWKGDKYGFAHATPRGMIWPYTFAALLPWSLVMLAWLARHGRQLPRLVRDEDGWVLYLALWTLMTPLFFTLSGNIIFPYPMPMLPGCALLFAELWLRARRNPDSGIALPLIAAIGALLLAGVLAVNHFQGDRYLRTQKDVIAAWRTQHPSPASALVYWSDSRAFSAEFYSHGRARTTEDPEQLRAWLSGRPGSFIVCQDKDLRLLPADIRARFEPVAQVRNVGNTFLLLGEAAPIPDAESHRHD